jgi:hypothetical protein
MIKRSLKVAIEGSVSIWRDFAASHLSDFSFTFVSSLYDLSLSDRSAVFTLDFTYPGPSSLPPFTPGADPFSSTFVYFYILQIPSDYAFSRSDHSRLQQWIRERTGTATQWYVYIFQESVSRFGSPWAVSLPDLDRHSTIVSFRHPLKFDVSSESFRTELHQRLTECLHLYEIEVSERRIIGFSNFRLRFSRALLFFYFGLLNTSATLFAQTYEMIASAFNEEPSGLVPPIEPGWISDHPHIGFVSLHSAMVCCVCGVMAVSILIGDEGRFCNAFLQHCAFLRLRESEECAVHWADQSIDAILAAVPLSRGAARNFLFNLFLLRLKQRGPSLDSVYHRLLVGFGTRRFMMAGIAFLYSEGEVVTDLTHGWLLSAFATKLMFSRGIASKDRVILEHTGPRLLEHAHVPVLEKREIVRDLIELRTKLVLQFVRQLTALAFGRRLVLGERISMHLKILGRVFPTEFDSMKICFVNGENRHSVVKRGAVVIGQRFLEIDMAFELSGNWTFERVKFYRGRVAFVWPVFSEASFSVGEQNVPELTVVFPRIIAVSTRMTMEFVIEYGTYLNCRAGRCRISLSFERYATVPDQSGETELENFSASSTVRIRIESSVFSSSSLQSIIIPSSVEILCSSCFSQCYSLSSMSFESQSRLKRIESSAFSYSSFQSIMVPSSVEMLCLFCFSHCYSFSSISFESHS